MGKLLKAITSFYRPYYLVAIAEMYARSNNDIGVYFRTYLQTTSFSSESVPSTRRSGAQELSVFLLLIVVLGNIVVASLLVAMTIDGTLPEGWIFALALLVLLPITTAFMAPITSSVAHTVTALSPKRVGYNVLSILLESQVKKLRQKNNIKVIAIAGSVGKTSSKLAIVHTLESSGLRVRYQDGNYNVRLTVPLVFFGSKLPNILNIIAWLRLLINHKRQIGTTYSYDVVVIELGTDGPGQMKDFAYLTPDITVLTAIAPEHMEYFGSLQAVADEELVVAQFSKKLLINTDDVAPEYHKGIKHISYGLAQSGKGYTAEVTSTEVLQQTIALFRNGQKYSDTTIQFLGAQGRKIVLAAAAVADLLQIAPEKVGAALTNLQPFPGRLQKLEGIKNSTLLDDTYNATPSAVEAALHVLGEINAPQRVAILGSMNELGNFMIEAHKTIGASLDPSKIDLVVTIGASARDYLAPAATAAGCRVVSFMNPHEAGLLVKSELLERGVVLAKGSQNGVFAEEALKPLLKHAKDQLKLVRQSSYWMKEKRKQFKLPKS